MSIIVEMGYVSSERESARSSGKLLIGHAVFLHRADFTSRFITTPASSDGTPLAVVDWPAVIAALDDGLPCSGSEVTAGSWPSAWLPCGSRGLFQQQLTYGQSGHD